MKSLLRSKLSRIFAPIGLGIVALATALSFPVLFANVSTYVPSLAQYNPLLIAYTYAQTAPETIAEMSTEVTGFADTLMPAWLVYVVFVLVAALGIWIIARAISGMKRG